MTLALRNRDILRYFPMGDALRTVPHKQYCTTQVWTGRSASYLLPVEGTFSHNRGLTQHSLLSLVSTCLLCFRQGMCCGEIHTPFKYQCFIIGLHKCMVVKDKNSCSNFLNLAVISKYVHKAPLEHSAFIFSCSCEEKGRCQKADSLIGW